MISVAFLFRPHGLQLARTAIPSMDRLGSDQMRTGHAVGTVDPPQMTQSVIPAKGVAHVSAQAPTSRLRSTSQSGVISADQNPQLNR
jgi:hypothetical protein